MFLTKITISNDINHSQSCLMDILLQIFLFVKKGVLIFIACGILGSCNQMPETIAFNDFKKQIPHLKLPYKVACYDSVTRLKLHIPDSLFKKYAPEGATGIAGIIMDTDSYCAILYSVFSDKEYPVIQTYDFKGEKLNDIGLINGTCCGEQPNCTGFSWGEITRDLCIVSIDSERIFKMDADGKPLASVNKFIDSTELYNITKDGFIRLNNSPTAMAQHKVKRLEKGDTGPKEEKEPIVSDSGAVATKDTNNSDDPTKIVYKVQILSSPTQIPPDDPRFKAVQGVDMYVEKSIYKYTIGHFTTREEALVMQIKLRASGFSEAFVVAFKGKNRV